jgi:hypothetical protein
MSLQRNNSVLRDDWLPDWLRAGISVPAPRQDEAVEALGPRGEGAPDPSVAQPEGTVIQPASGQIDGSGECVHVQSAEGIPLDALGLHPPAAHGPIYAGSGFIPIEPEGEFPLDDLTGPGGVEIQPADGTTDVNVDPERDRSVK